MPKSFVFYFPKSSVILSKDLPRTTLHLWWPWKILTSKDSKNLRRIFNPSLSRQVFMKTPTNCWQFHLKQIRLQILTGIWTLMEDHWSRKKLKVKNSYFFEFLKFTFSNFFSVFSSPLEMTYDKTTINSLMSLFRTPDDIDLQNLQHQAISKLKEYRESSALSLQYVIDNHDLMDVDIRLMSSYFILPHSGVFTEKCACAIVNLGKLKCFNFTIFRV